MPILIIAEKPSMAADIAKALGGFSRKQGYYSSEQYLLTWAVGHLVELVPPERYHAAWKAWRAASLPIIPPEFRLMPIAKTESQFNLIRKLMLDPTVTELINACDAGREGELIFRYIVELVGCRKPIRRLWISSLTASAIRKGFQDLALRPSDEIRFEQLYRAARCRSEADWLVGINASRAVTIRQRTRGKGELYSLGRVQTPTLALLVERELEIAAFEPRPYWLIEAKFSAAVQQRLSDEHFFSGRWFQGENDRIWSSEEAEKLLEKLRQPGLPTAAKVLAVQSKERRELPPLLFDLTSLQREANRRFGFSASRTLKAAQRLYEHHKLISYPRTDSRYLTPDLIPSLPRRMQAGQKNSPYEQFIDELLQLPKLPISGRIVNAARVRDHHALIPTEVTVPWASLSGDERRILDLIHQAFVSIFFPEAIWLDRDIVSECKSELFRSKEAQLLNPGWRKVHHGQSTEAKLPDLSKGDPLLLHELDAIEEITKPPARYSEGTLLTAMEKAGSLLDDEALQEAMRDSGLGTAATRAATIERLKQMDYIEGRKRELLPTAKGITLIQNLPVEALRSPRLTGQWEAKLAAIQDGQYDAGRFMNEMTIFVSDLTAQCLSSAQWQQDEARQALSQSARQARPAEAGERNVRGNQAPEGGWGNCPLCGAEIRENRKAFYCSRWRDESPCSFTIWKEIAGKTLTTNQVLDLIRSGKTKLLKGFRSKKGSKFDAVLILEEGKVSMQIQARTSKSGAKAKAPGTAEKKGTRRNRAAPNEE